MAKETCKNRCDDLYRIAVQAIYAAFFSGELTPTQFSILLLAASDAHKECIDNCKE